MDFNQTKQILETVASHGKSGCGIITLANETNISQSQLREFLDSNNDFFCQLNNKSTYALNAFGKYKGSVEAMLQSVSERNEKTKLNQLILVACVAFVFGFIIGGI